MGSLKLTHRALSQLVEPVIPFADPHSSLAALGCVRLRGLGGIATAEAVGEYQGGYCQRPALGADAGVSMVLPVDALTHLLNVAGGHGGERVITFTPDEDASTVTVVVAGLTGTHASVHRLDAYRSDSFPRLSRAIQRAIDSTGPGKRMRIDPTRLADFGPAHAERNNPDTAPLVIYPGEAETSALLVTCGDHFIGLLSPSKSLRKATKIRAGSTQPPDLTVWAERLS